MLSVFLIQLAQEALNPKLFDLLGQGIISAVILVIWFYQFKHSVKQIDEQNKRYEQILDTLIEQFNKENEYKQLIAGLNAGIDNKLDNLSKDIERAYFNESRK